MTRASAIVARHLSQPISFREAVNCVLLGIGAGTLISWAIEALRVAIVYYRYAP